MTDVKTPTYELRPPKWEHTFIDVDCGDAIDPATTRETLSSMSEAGWELVSVQTSARTESGPWAGQIMMHRLYFKRAKHHE